MNPRHWYHCTDEDMGERWTAKRIVPPLVRQTSEPLTPRLCVCSTIARCFIARLMRHSRSVWVYRTEQPRRANRPPKSVWDRMITQERWIVPPCEMVLQRVIPEDVVWNANLAMHAFFRGKTKPAATWKIRVAHYAVVIKALDQHDTTLVKEHERGTSESWLEYAEITDPEEYLYTLE